MSEGRPSFFQRLSHQLLPQDALSAPYTRKTSNETTPLLSKKPSPRSPSTLTPARPAVVLAATTKSIPTLNITTDLPTTPLLSRPVLQRAATATDAVRLSNRDALTPTKPGRPSLLRRATDVVAASLTLGSADEDQPSAPTYWVDHVHRKPLLRIWDSLTERTGPVDSTTELVIRAQSEMLRQYGELESGDVVLTKDWIEHVLGTCLRNPFCTTKEVGRWQKLATAAGPRGNWGPF